MKYKLLCLVLGPLLLSACASSDGLQHSKSEPVRKIRKANGPITSIRPASLLFASFNRNDDYSIDQKEFADGLQKSFQIADSNKDERLSPFELEHWRKNALGSVDASPGSMTFDADFNQVVTHAEFDAALGKLYQASDRDGNGIISFDELVKVISRPTPRSNGTKKKSPERKRGGKGGGGRHGG
ncbi:MAG: hypothetical protein L3J65_02360 [Robiginitomaculum sp.]|nr:hypothetical protein [Robiginitomaculum sp.]